MKRQLSKRGRRRHIGGGRFGRGLRDCASRVRYSEPEAAAVARRQIAEGDATRSIVPYPCPVCGCWHVSGRRNRR